MNPMHESNSTQSSEEITTTKRRRGRPRKSDYLAVPSYSAVYNTPLGYQYVPPKQFPITMGYNNSLYRPPLFMQYPSMVTPYFLSPYNPYSSISENTSTVKYKNNIDNTRYIVSSTENRNIDNAKCIDKTRKRRRSALTELSPLVHIEEEEEEIEEGEIDTVERLVGYDEKTDTFLVKHRGLSYLHCTWLHRNEITPNKTKRYKGFKFDPDILVVERVLAIQDKQYLIKWNKISIEYATFETDEDIESFRYEDMLKDYVDMTTEEDDTELEIDGNDDKCIDDNIIEEETSDNKEHVVAMDDTAILDDTNIVDDNENDTVIVDDRLRTSFKKALADFHRRVSLCAMPMCPVEWRPPKEQQHKFIETDLFKGHSLRTYQVEGLNWLLNRWHFRQSCIMADEMGLGKTVQSVCFIDAIHKSGYTHPVIVVSPLSTLIHWEREFSRWTNLRVLLFHGSLKGRDTIYNYEFYYNGVPLFDVLLTTYETVMSSIKQIQPIEFGVAVLDEAHRLKNANSKATQLLRTLRTTHRILLSGTPLQNNLSELWSLLHFISPGMFPSISDFLSEYKLEKSEDVDRLQALLRPLMLRRLKEDVEKSIPLKEETIIEVELTQIQKKYYRAILEKNMEFLTSDSAAPNLLNAMMELRKCCIHPYLIRGAEESIISNYKMMKYMNSGINEDANSNMDEYYKVLIQSSGKLVLLDKLLAKLHGSHKILIFSQMTRLLDILSDYLSYRKYSFERIDGGVRGDLRQAAIDRFTNGDTFVFLLCTRAGGVGINLTAADTVVIFDSDWNPQNDLQAQARCHRIGQTREVKIYRLITRNTYEREMFDKAGLKLGLDRAVLQKMTGEVQGEQLNRRDAVELLLKKGAYGVLMETDEQSQRFCEEDIDSILERRTQVIRHTDGKNVFSKATFQAEEEIDDPMFWERLLEGKMKTESEGRVKRQMRRLARDGVLDSSIDINKDSLTNNNIALIDNKIPTDIALYVFRYVLKMGVKALLSNHPEYKDILNAIIRHCLDLIPNKKIKEDMGCYIDQSSTTTTNIVIQNNDEIKKLGNAFLLRIQVVAILGHLLKKTDIPLDRGKGWSPDQDKRLVNWVISNGYDNYPTSVGQDKGFMKGRSADELNQRVRRIVQNMNNKIEREEEKQSSDALIINLIMQYGKVNNKNRSSISELCNLEEYINFVDKISNKRRRNGEEAIVYDRLVLLDKYINATISAIKRSSGLPRKWNIESDLKMQEMIEKMGISEKVLSILGISEEIAITRMRQIVKECREEE